MKNFIWDSLVSKYVRSIRIDKNSDFAYEKLVNSLSLLSLCDNSGFALDLGCGDGRFTRELEARYKKVYAVDYSEKMLNVAKINCNKTKFFKVDLEKPFPSFDIRFDLVVCKLVLMYIENIDNIARESCKFLNRGGILVVSVTHPLKWVDKYSYLSENLISGEIAKDKNLEVVFRSRTLETYINTFTKHGFNLESVLETGVPDTFVIKYPGYMDFQKKPYRLNLKFVKK